MLDYMKQKLFALLAVFTPANLARYSFSGLFVAGGALAAYGYLGWAVGFLVVASILHTLFWAAQ